MVWENICFDGNAPLDTVWKKIKLVGGSLGFTPAQMCDKLKLCVHPNLYATVMGMEDTQKILEIARQWSAFSKSCGVTDPAQPVTANKVDSTPAFMAMSDSFHVANRDKSKDRKWKRRMRGMENNLQTLLKGQADLNQALMNQAVALDKPYSRG